MHFDKIYRMLKVSKITFRRITNLKHMQNSRYECVKINVIKIQKFVLTLILLPRIMLFFKPEVLKNGMKFELRNSIKGVSVIKTYISRSQKAHYFIGK